MKPDILQIAYPFYHDDPATMTPVLEQVHQPFGGTPQVAQGLVECMQEDFVAKHCHAARADGTFFLMFPKNDYREAK